MRVRPQDWPERLAAYLLAHQSVRFAWGAHDCATFAARWVATLWPDADPLRQLCVTYSGKAQALRLIRRCGGLSALARAYFGEPIAAALAQRGDIVLIDNGGREVLSVCVGAHAAGPALDGLTLVPMTAAVRAWPVDGALDV